MMPALQQAYLCNIGSFIPVRDVPQILGLQSLLLAQLDEAIAVGEEHLRPHTRFFLWNPALCKAQCSLIACQDQMRKLRDTNIQQRSMAEAPAPVHISGSS